MKPFKPPSPLATNSLIGLCVAVQGALLIGGSSFGASVIYAYGLVPARMSAAIAGIAPPSSALPTVLTHIFLHGGLIHLALNMVFLAWVGRYVEWVAGRVGLVSLFLTGGFVGGIAQILAAPQSPTPVIGASGAIACVFGAYAVMFAKSRVQPRRILGVSVSGETLTALWYAASWIGLQLLVGIAFAEPGGGLLGGGIAIWTHIGGFLTGLVLARRWGRGPKIDL